MSRAAQYRKRGLHAPSDVTLPSGEVFSMRPFNAEAWLITGHVPEHIVRSFLALEEAGAQSVAGMLDDPTGLSRFDEVMRAVICYCSHDPIIRPEALGEDELAIDEIEYTDRKHLFLWLTKQLPEAEVVTTQGSVTVDAVTQFRDGAEGSADALDSSDGADVQSATVKAAGDS